MLEDGQLGRRYSVVQGIDGTLWNMARDTMDHTFSKGGMRSKLQAAERVISTGENLWIADGSKFSVLRKVFNGEDVGTVFLSDRPARMRGFKRFLAFFSDVSGTVEVDEGAQKALCESGRSLLPSGVTKCYGSFSRGATVRVVNVKGEEIARGLSNYGSDEILRIAGLHTTAIAETLGHEGFSEVIHRNYLVVTV
jgi:glutamate 5-kinase